MNLRLYGGNHHGETIVMEDFRRVIEFPIRQAPLAIRPIRNEGVPALSPYSTEMYRVEQYSFSHGRLAGQRVRVGLAAGYHPTRDDEYRIKLDVADAPFEYHEISILHDFDDWFDQTCHKVTGFTYYTRDPLRIV